MSNLKQSPPPILCPSSAFPNGDALFSGNNLYDSCGSPVPITPIDVLDPSVPILPPPPPPPPPPDLVVIKKDNSKTLIILAIIGLYFVMQ